MDVRSLRAPGTSAPCNELSFSNGKLTFCEIYFDGPRLLFVLRGSYDTVQPWKKFVEMTVDGSEAVRMIYVNGLSVAERLDGDFRNITFGRSIDGHVHHAICAHVQSHVPMVRTQLSEIGNN